MPAHHPGTVRVPALVVVTRESSERVDRDGGLLRATDVVLAVEVFSTGSRRTDSVSKHTEYADAGIGHYWTVDLLAGPARTACHLAGGFGYADAAPVPGVITLDAPFPACLDLDRLR